MKHVCSRCPTVRPDRPPRLGRHLHPTQPDELVCGPCAEDLEAARRCLCAPEMDEAMKLGEVRLPKVHDATCPAHPKGRVS